MYMTDQDLDGSHIKGLVLTCFIVNGILLLKSQGSYLYEYSYLKSKKGTQIKLFYNDGEYNEWKEILVKKVLEDGKLNIIKVWVLPLASEFKEYFANKKIVDFVYTGNVCDDMIDKIFNKKRADDRKHWLENDDKLAYLDTNQTKCTI